MFYGSLSCGEFKNKNILALIASAGSKGLSDKNIKMFNGKPLIAHSIELAKSCEVINRIFGRLTAQILLKSLRNMGRKSLL